MQTVNIYFEIWRNSDSFDSSSDQTDTGYANIIRPQFNSNIVMKFIYLNQGSWDEDDWDRGGCRAMKGGRWKNIVESVRSKTYSDGRRYKFLKADETNG